MGIDFVLQRAWKIIFLALVIVAIGILINSFLSVISGAAGDALSAMSSKNVAAFVPSNLTTVIGTMITVKMSGTVYVAAMNFIQTKVTILK